MIEHFGLDYQSFACDGFRANWSQACCWFGHAKIWSGLPDGWHLVIEDDAVPIADLTGAIHAATQSSFDLVKLHHRAPYDPHSPLQVLPLGLDVWISTTAYLVRNPRLIVNRLRLGPIDRVLQDQFDVGAVIPKLVESQLGRDEPTSLCYEGGT